MVSADKERQEKTRELNTGIIGKDEVPGSNPGNSSTNQHRKRWFSVLFVCFLNILAHKSKIAKNRVL